MPIEVRMEKVKGRIDGTTSYMARLVPRRPPDPSARWTAPAPAVPVAPVTAPLAQPIGAVTDLPNVPLTDPIQILDLLVDDVEGVRGAILASVDGFGLARSSAMADEPSHPAMLAAAVGLAHQLAAVGGGQQLRQLVVDHDGGLMLMWPIGPYRVLAVLAATSVEQRRVRSFVHSHSALLAEAPGESS